jgi:DNA-directed RNA polymerase subunit M/transcription elongation factor TFIIS
LGEATVEREREEREAEVLTVSREIETCERCGARRIVSENTEVTTVEPAPEEETEEDDAGLGGVVTRSESEVGEGLEPPEDPAEEDAEILTRENEEREPGEWPSEPGEPGDATEEATTEESAPDLATTRADEPPSGTFRCTNCGFTADSEGSALREGDACPECMEGYLETG